MKTKDFYECYVDCWKVFLTWIKNWKSNPNADIFWKENKKSIQDILDKYEKTEQKDFVWEILTTLSSQMDYFVSNNIILDD